MQADGRLIQHEQRVDERGAERRREVDALDFAAGQRARLAVERQISEADIVEIVETGADFTEQQICCFVEWLRQVQFLKERAGALQRQKHDVVNGEAGQRAECFVAPFHACGVKALLRRQPFIRQLAAAEPPQQRFGLEPCAIARETRRVCAISGEQHAHVHLVRLGLEPFEEAPGAVPDVLAPRPFAVDDPRLVRFAQLAPRAIERDAALLAELDEVVLTFLVRLRLPRANGSAAQGFAFVRDDEAIVDADGSAETFAGFARAHGRVEREEAGDRLAVRQVAVGAVELARVAPGFEASRRIAVVDDVHLNAAAADAQGGFERFEDAAAFGGAGANSVLNDDQRLRRGLALFGTAFTRALRRGAFFSGARRVRSVPAGAGSSGSG